jgi:hypothetical protein
MVNTNRDPQTGRLASATNLDELLGDVPIGGVTSAVEELFSRLTLDAFGKARAEIALVLARGLDQASSGQVSGAFAQSVPGMAKELRATIDEIRASINETDPFLESLAVS